METVHEFIEREISLWGFEYIESLFSKGYEPKLTTAGWRWLRDLTTAPVCATVDSARSVAFSRLRRSVA